jgi:hypothetical protein
MTSIGQSAQEDAGVGAVNFSEERWWPSRLTVTATFNWASKRRIDGDRSTLNPSESSFSDFETMRFGRISEGCWRRFGERLFGPLVFASPIKGISPSYTSDIPFLALVSYSLERNYFGHPTW